MGLKHKKKMIFWYALVIFLIPVLAYVASVAINDQTKTTDVATDDVYPLYDTSATAGRGITGQNLASGLAAIIVEGDLTDSSVVSADIKNATIAQDDVAQTLTYGASESQTITSAQDEWAGVTISNSHTAVTAETRLLLLDFSEDEDDTSLTYLDIHDSGGSIFKFAGAATRAQMTGDFDIVITALDLGDNDITNIGSIAIDAITADGTNVLFGTGATTQLQFRDTAIYIASLNDGYLDIEADTQIRFLGPMYTGETFTSTNTITTSAAIIGELDEVDESLVAGDALSATQCRGRLLTNEGDADGETWELPTAEKGLHFKVICAVAQDIVLDADTNDMILVSDDDAITGDSDDNNVTMDCANVGESMTCVTFSTDGSAWDWLCECGAGECDEAA